MGQIDRKGTFIAAITEAAFSTTAKDLPQFVGKFLATKKYVVDADELAHFKMTEPGYVDWNFDESIIGYLVLFNDNGPLKNYEQLCVATGWDGQDFQTINELAGKSVLIRVEEDTYKDKTTLKVQWIDHPEAPPERSLKSLDADKTKALTNRFLAAMKKPAAPAKPAVAKPAAPVTVAAASATPSVPAASVTPAAPIATPAVEAPKPKTPPKKKEKAAEPPAAPAPAAPGALPASCSKMEAWEYVSSPAVKGSNEDSVIEEAWIAATSEVGETTDEKDFTAEMWAKVRDTIVKDLK